LTIGSRALNKLYLAVVLVRFSFGCGLSFCYTIVNLDKFYACFLFIIDKYCFLLEDELRERENSKEFGFMRVFLDDDN
jgi:hypothetical protein